MKRMLYRPLSKALAVLLLTASAFMCLACGLAALYFALADDPADSLCYDSTPVWRMQVERFNSYAFDAYYYGTYLPGKDPELAERNSVARQQRLIDPARTNYRYEIVAADGTVLESSFLPDDTRSQGVIRSHRIVLDGLEVMVCGRTLDPLRVDDAFLTCGRVFDLFANNRDALPVLTAVTLLVSLALTVGLCCAAGRRPDTPELRRGFVDRIPTDVLLAGAGLAEYGIVALCAGVSGTKYLPTDPLFVWLAGFAAFICFAVALRTLLSVAVRIKTRTFFTNTLAYRALRLCLRAVRWAYRGVRGLFAELPLLWKTVVFFAVFGFVNALCLFTLNSGLMALLFVAFNVAVFAGAIALTRQMDKLKKAGEALAAGRLETRVVTQGMFAPLKAHGDALNSVGLGMSRAVDERMKSERMKTDLITNVSHDLKTPLTSIISYVDLLKKERLPEPAADYVAVLERQSARLKKLTEDVVEASKASSGTIRVSLAPTNAAEILNQSLAEYAERLGAVPLTVVAAVPETPQYIMADGRLLWRVFDNLLGNVVKYALPGTRVYCAVDGGACEVVVTLKNVSRDALNITPEELTERFVRGDASRASDGSGLGLSIAKSLVELQNGSFALAIDGDLFTAKVAFTRLPASE